MKTLKLKPYRKEEETLVNQVNEAVHSFYGSRASFLIIMSPLNRDDMDIITTIAEGPSFVNTLEDLKDCAIEAVKKIDMTIKQHRARNN